MHRPALAIAVLCSACARPAPHPVVTSSPGPATTMERAVADGSIEVSGRIRAHDGAPLRDGKVTLMRIGFTEPAAQAELDAEGRFALRTTKGAYHVWIAAADHAEARRTTVLGDDLTIVGELGTRATETTPGEPERLEWTGESTTSLELRTSMSTWQTQLGALRKQAPVTDGLVPAPTDADRRATKAIADAAARKIEAIADPRTQVLMRAAHMSTFAPFVHDPADPRPAGHEHLPWILEHVPPEDPHLAVLMNLDHLVARTSKVADDVLWAKTAAWLERRILENPEPSCGIQALTILLDRAERRGDTEREHELYARAQDERYVGTFYRTFIEQQYAPDRLLQRGKPLPAFEFAALDGKTTIRSADRAGKLYLLEFWATWCGPCVVEMPRLHDAYAAVNGAKVRGGSKAGDQRKLGTVADPAVEFVFVSFDTTPQSVAEFRRKFWSMPWTHAYVGNGDPEKVVMERFGFSGVPTAILVDEQGVILELGDALRAEQLQVTLERVLAERRKSPA